MVNENGHRRFFRSGELHLVLLALLAARPQHGYELMSELSARFGPGYRPSPGSIYPALNALEAEGLVAATDDGDRRVYRATATGLRAVEARRPLLGTIEARTGTQLGGPSLESALARFTERVRAVASSVDRESVERLLDDAAARIEQGAKERP
jgi:DNA-binding PadR family transcriptional regulator